jgi:glutaminyl-peptide cyclotransferase
MDGTFGIDFLFFDGEEFVIVRQRDPMFLGSTFFARSYLDKKLIPWSYEQAILVDMVADKDLQIFMEQNSLNFAKELTHEIFGVANDIGVKEFIPKEGKLIRDDHLPLNQIARIPTCDLIDFDFPNPAAKNAFWHTRNDNVKNCSAESLGKVGSVVLAWLRKKQKGN